MYFIRHFRLDDVKTGFLDLHKYSNGMYWLLCNEWLSLNSNIRFDSVDTNSTVLREPIFTVG